MSNTDDILIKKYRKMLKLEDLDSSTNSSSLYFKCDVQTDKFNILNNATMNNMTVMSYLTVSNMIINHITTLTNFNGSNNLWCSTNLTILSDLSIKSSVSNINCTTTNLINYSNISILSDLYTSNISNICSITNNIYPNNTEINIFSPVINIGTTNNIINIIGTNNSIFVNTLNIFDNMISLNINISTSKGFDIGNDSGIEIAGYTTLGYIKTTSDALRYLLKLPSYNTVNYIATQDINNNFNISGISTIGDTLTGLSDIYILNNLNIESSCVCNNNLYTSILSTNIITSQSLTISNACYINDLVNVNNNATIFSIILNNYTTNNLFVNNNSIINTNITINNSLTVNSNLITEGNITTNTLVVTNNTIINRDLTLASRLIINSDQKINNNLTSYSNLYISSNAILNNNSTCLSNITISGDTFIANTLSCDSCNIIGNIFMQLKEYPDNITALYDGLPVWSWYRTGDILKICIPDPNIILNDVFFWIDPSDSTTITLSSDNVTRITSKKNSIIMNSYVNQPKLKVNGINTMTVIDCTNSGALISQNTYLNSYNVTLAIVITMFYPAQWGTVWGHFDNHDREVCLRTPGGGNLSWHTYNDFNTIGNLPYPQFIPIICLCTLTNGTKKSFKMVNLNTGIESITTGETSLGMLILSCYLYLGCSERTNELAKCYIGECLYWKRVLNDDELTTIQLYLYNKWKAN